MKKRAFTVAFFLTAIAVAIGWKASYGSREEASTVRERREIAAAFDSLTEAVCANDLKSVKLLVMRGAAADETDASGETPLIAAIRTGHREATRLLLPHVEKIEEVDGRGLTALGHALLREDWETAGDLASRGALIDVNLERGRPAIVDAVAARHERLVGFLLDRGANVNVRGEEGITPLILALIQEDRLLVERLLLGGADPNATDARGNSPVLIAARLRDLAALKLLAAHGADLNPDHGTITPLAIAVSGNDGETAAFLLDNGVVPDEAEGRRFPLLLTAVRHGNTSMVRALAAAGASPEVEGVAGETALGAALKRAEADIFRALLEFGAPVEPVIGEIIATGNERFIDVLIELEIDLSGVAGENEETPLASLVYGGNAALAEKVLRAGASPEVKCRDGQSVLAWAIAHRRPGLVEALLDAGADPDARLANPVSAEFKSMFGEEKLSYYLNHDSGLTPLMVATGSFQKEIVEDLLKRGAKPGLHTNRYKTYPIQFAAQLQDTDLMQMLLGKEAGDKTRRIVIDLSSQQAWLYLNGETHLSTSVSTGKKGYETPAGEYVVTNKYRDWTSTIYGAKMPYFLRLNTGKFGLHEGHTPDYPASHGCIRMPGSSAKKFFQIVEVGDLVSINQ